MSSTASVPPTSSSSSSSSSSTFNEPPFLAKLTPHISEVFQLLLQHRPEDPLRFCAEYFCARANGTPLPTVISLPTTTASHSREAVLEAIAQQFFASNPIQDPITGELGLKSCEYVDLIKKLCIEFLPEITSATIQVFVAKDFITFHDFCLGVNACLLFSEFFEKAESLFQVCHPDRNGRVPRATIEPVLKTFVSQAHSFHTPPAEQASAIWRFLDHLKSSESISFREFALAVFHTTELPIELPNLPPPPSSSAFRSSHDSSSSSSSSYSQSVYDGTPTKSRPNPSSSSSSDRMRTSAFTPQHSSSSSSSSSSSTPSRPLPLDDGSGNTMTLASLLNRSGGGSQSKHLATIDLTSLLSSLSSYESGQTARDSNSTRPESAKQPHQRK